MKQALYDAFHDLLEAPQDLSCIQAGQTVVVRIYDSDDKVFCFSRRRVDMVTNDLLILRPIWDRHAPDLCFGMNGKERGGKGQMYLPSHRFKSLFSWQEAIESVRHQMEVLRYLGLRDRERFYQLLMTLPVPDPDHRTPFLLHPKMPDRSKEERQAFLACYRYPQDLNSVRKGQKVVWICLPRSSALPVIVSTKVARSTKNSLFLCPDESMRNLLHMSAGKEIRFNRQGYRKKSLDRLFLPHKMFDYLAYSEALSSAIGELYRTRIHLASEAQVLSLLSFLGSFPQSYHYYLPDSQGQ